MKRSIKNEIQEEADRILSSKLPRHWIIRDQNDQDDLGVDFEIEITTKKTGYSESTGNIFKIQNKGHENVAILQNGKLSQQINLDNIKYFFDQFSVPLIITITDNTKKITYWHPVQLDENIENQIKIAEEKGYKSIQVHIDSSRIINENSISTIEKAVANSMILLSAKKFDPKIFDPKLFNSTLKQAVREQVIQLELDSIYKDEFTDDIKKSKFQYIYQHAKNPNHKYIALYNLNLNEYDPDKNNIEVFGNHFKEYRKLAKQSGSVPLFIDYLCKVKFYDLLSNCQKFNNLNSFKLEDAVIDRETNIMVKIPEVFKLLSSIGSDTRQIKRGIELFGIELVSFYWSGYANYLAYDILIPLYYWRYARAGDIYIAMANNIEKIYHPLWAMGIVSYKEINKKRGIEYISTSLAVKFLVSKWTLELTDPNKVNRDDEQKKNSERQEKMIRDIAKNEEDAKLIINALWTKTDKIQKIIMVYDFRPE